MKRKKLLTVFLATMMVLSSSVSVFANGTKSTSNENKNISSRDNEKRGDLNNTNINKYANAFKDFNVGKAMVAAKAKAVSTPKVEMEVKDCVEGKDYNLGKDVNIGSAVRSAQEKAKEVVKVTPPKVEISQELKDQIKAEYTDMRAIEVTNKATFVAAINKKNQVVSYIHKVAEGKLTYTDAQLTSLDDLSITFITDINAITDATALIKTDEAAVKASAKDKDFTAVLAGLKIEKAARIARGAALTKVNEDLDAFLLVLIEGQVVLPTPATDPAVVPAT